MTNPSPQLIDTIARAMWEADDEPGSWDRHLDYAQKSQVGLEEVEAWRDRARAALAAMPEPIGYAVTMHPHLPTWIRGADVYPTTAGAEMYADELRSLTYAAGLTPTVVALVPVGGDHA